MKKMQCAIYSKKYNKKYYIFRNYMVEYFAKLYNDFLIIFNNLLNEFNNLN